MASRLQNVEKDETSDLGQDFGAHEIRSRRKVLGCCIWHLRVVEAAAATQLGWQVSGELKQELSEMSRGFNLVFFGHLACMASSFRLSRISCSNPLFS